VDLLLLWSLDLVVIRPSLKGHFVIWLLNIFQVVIVKKYVACQKEYLGADAVAHCWAGQRMETPR
jgi:hypothetical protein